MTLFCTRFSIEPKDHTHDHGLIGFSRGSWVFQSFPFMRGGISPVENCNLKGRDTKKWFSLCRRPLILPKIYLAFRSLSFIDRELFLFHFHFLPLFGRESFFLFVFMALFFIFIFFLFFLSISSFSFFSLLLLHSFLWKIGF